MKQLQFIFDEVAEKKMEVRDIKELYKSTIEQIAEHAEIVEQIKVLREKKKMLELKAQQSLGTSWEKLEDLRDSMAADKVMMTDVALTDLMAGKTVMVADSFGNEYEPIWSVRFKKTNNQNKD